MSGTAGAAGSQSAGMGGSAGSGTAGTSGAAGGTSGSGGSGCVPTETSPEVTCNGIDDDCNGKIDDVDTGMDGVCDCLRIGIVGNPGANPSSNFQAWLESLGTTTERVNKVATDAFDAPLLSKFDVVIVDRLTRSYTTAEADIFKTWVEGGGGFVTMTGYANSPNPDFLPNTLLAPFGLSYGGALSSATADTFFPHPVTKGITSVTFLGGYVVTPTPVMGGTSTLLAANADGNIAYAHERGKGRGVVWGDEWIEFDSEWQTKPQIQQLWVNIMDWVGPQTFCNVKP
jgi:hypothetical protein